MESVAPLDGGGTLSCTHDVCQVFKTSSSHEYYDHVECITALRAGPMNAAQAGSIITQGTPYSQPRPSRHDTKGPIPTFCWRGISRVTGLGS